MAVRTPMPPMKGTGIRKPKRARLGMVWARLARARTGRARRGRRARAMPSGTPIATAMPAETRTSRTCWPVRSSSQSACDAAPLALAARKLGGGQGCEAARIQADEGEQFVRPRGAPRRRPPHQLGYQSHVALHGEVGDQPRFLDDVAGAAPQLDGVPRLEPPPQDHDRAGVGLDQAVEGLERGRLARAAGAEQDQHTAVFDRQREAVEGHASARIALVDVDELDGDGHGRPAAIHSSASCLPSTRACSRFVSPPRKKVFRRRLRVTPSPSTWTLTLWVPAGTSSVADSLPDRKSVV